MGSKPRGSALRRGRRRSPSSALEGPRPRWRSETGAIPSPTGAWVVSGAAEIVLLAVLDPPRGICAVSDEMAQAIGRQIE